MKFAVVDVETTGGNPKSASLTEIGVVIIEDGNITNYYQSLVKPNHSIPPQIESLTGITNEMVQDAPSFESLLPSLQELFEDAVFVAHHVLFDYRFVKEAFKRVGVDYNASKRLCTVRFSRLLFPDLKSYSLRSLCQFFQVYNDQPHRALSDAKATAEILLKLLDKDEQQQFQQFFKQRSSVLNLPPWMSKSDVNELPKSPGVYRFYDTKGKLIYVGKAKNLRNRVKSHFSGESSRVGALLVAKSASMDIELTGSELMAGLLEDHEIRHFWPRLNSAQKQNAIPYHIVHYQDHEGAHRLGIYRKRVCLNSLKQFYTLYGARDWLIRQVEEYQLIGEKCHVSAWSEAEELTIAKHNSNMESFLKELGELQQSFVMLLKGREEGETGFVWIQDDVYKGTGFISSDEAIEKPEDLEPFVTVRKSSPTVWSLLENYRAKNKHLQLLEL